MAYGKLDLKRLKPNDRIWALLIDTLWREKPGLFVEKFLSEPDPDEPKQNWLGGEISEDVDFGLFLGQDHQINGNRSIAIGQGLNTGSFMEILIGAYATIAENQTADEWVETDRLLALGNSPDDTERSNALEIFKSGLLKLMNAVKLSKYAHGAFAPEDGMLQYTPEAALELRHLNAWIQILTEAPADGKAYGRKDGQWAEVIPNSTATMSAILPADSVIVREGAGGAVKQVAVSVFDDYYNTKYARKAAPETISGLWNFATAPTILGNTVYHSGNANSAAHNWAANVLTAASLNVTGLTTGYLPYKTAGVLGNSPIFNLNNDEIIIGNNTYYSSSGGHTKVSNYSNSGIRAGYSSGQYSNDTGGNVSYWVKSRGASIGSQGSVSNGDEVRVNLYEASDGTSIKRGARNDVMIDGTVSSSIVPMRFTWQTMNTAGTLAERMRLASSGNLLINTTTDNAVDKLQVNGSLSATTAKLSSITNNYFPFQNSGALATSKMYQSGENIRVSSSGNFCSLEVENLQSVNGRGYITVLQNSPTSIGVAEWVNSSVIESIPNATDGGNFFIGAFRGDIRLQTARVTRATLKGNGNLLIATTTDNATDKLQVNGSASTYGNLNIGGNSSANPFSHLRLGASQFGAADIRPTNEGNHKVGLAFYTDGTDGALNPVERIRLTSSGNLGVGITTPEKTLHVNNSFLLSSSGFAGLDIRSGRTVASDNIGGYRFFNSQNNEVSGIFSTVGGDIKFSTGGSAIYRMTILNNGLIGINTTSPQSTLDVNGTISKNGTALFLDKLKTGAMGAAGQVPVANGPSSDFTWATLSSSNLSEGTNLFYTDTRSRSSISLTTTGTSGAATYNSATGVINIPNYTTTALNLSTLSAPDFTRVELSPTNYAHIPAATSSLSGVMTNADRVKLDGIEPNANYYGGFVFYRDWQDFSYVQNGGSINFSAGSGISLSKSGETLTITNSAQFPGFGTTGSLAAAGNHTHALKTINGNSIWGTGDIVITATTTPHALGSHTDVNQSNPQNYDILTYEYGEWYNFSLANLLYWTQPLKTINGQNLIGSGNISVTASSVWGSITGTLSAQSDLQNALNAKASLAGSLSQAFSAQRFNLPSGGYIEVQGTTVHIYSGSNNVVVHGQVTADSFYKN